MDPNKLEKVYENMVDAGVPDADEIFVKMIWNQLRRHLEVAIIDGDKLAEKQQVREAARRASGETHIDEINRICEEDVDKLREKWKKDEEALKPRHWSKDHARKWEEYTTARDLRQERRSRDVQEELKRQRQEATGEVDEGPARKRRRLVQEIDSTHRVIATMNRDIEEKHQEIEQMADEAD